MSMLRRSRRSRRCLAVFIAFAVFVGVPGVVSAATISTPSSEPFVVPADDAGRPLSFEVVASGYEPGVRVFVEQCDGLAPSAPGWTPLEHCDNATAPAAVEVGADGSARFSAKDPNFAFTPFTGKSPQGLFNCLAPGQPSLSNGLPDFFNCRIRVASDTLEVTADQAFRAIRVPSRRPSRRHRRRCRTAVPHRTRRRPRA